MHDRFRHIPVHKLDRPIPTATNRMPLSSLKSAINQEKRCGASWTLLRMPQPCTAIGLWLPGLIAAAYRELVPRPRILISHFQT